MHATVGSSTRPRRARPAPGRALRAGAAWLALLVAVVAIWPAAWGGRSTLVLVTGDSMSPTYADGDLVWAYAGAPEVGDAVVFTPDELDGARVVHRIVATDAAGWVTQGDNNPAPDPFPATPENVVGVARVALPTAGAGRLLRSSPLVGVGLVLLAAALAVWPAPARARAGAGDGRANP